MQFLQIKRKKIALIEYVHWNFMVRENFLMPKVAIQKY